MEQIPGEDSNHEKPFDVANNIIATTTFSKSKMGVDSDNAPIYPRFLCHYTSYASFQKIVDTKSVILSPLSYTNDYSEFRSGFHEIMSLFELFMEKYGENVDISKRKLIDAFISHGKTHRDNVYFRQFLSCWSQCDPTDTKESPDRLSMWRGYAADGHGVCMVLDLNKVNVADIAPSNIILLPVLYESKDQLRARADESFGMFLHQIDQKGEKLNWDASEIKDAMIYILNVLAITHKHPAYSEEQEWRLVCDYDELSNYVKNMKEFPVVRNLDYIIDNNPRAVVRLFLDGEKNADPIQFDMRELLSDVYIGPCSWELQHQRMLAVKSHLRKNDFRIRDDENSEGPGVHVRYSEIPYRGRG